MHTDGLRVLTHAGSILALSSTARVHSWRTEAVSLVDPELAGTTVELGGVTAASVEHGVPARTLLTAECGTVELLDRLVSAAEAVGRAAPGVALVRLLRCLDGPLDVALQVSVGAPSVPWTRLNRVAFGYLAGRKVTVDGGELDVRGSLVTSRLRAERGAWTALTVAVDGHLPAEPDVLLAHR